MSAPKSRPSLAVVTPSFNQGRFIDRTIRSVIDQGIDGLDYVVMDGGSTDETLDVLRRHEERLRWVSEPDRGQTDAVNKGIAATKSEIVGWLNSDDVYYPGALSAILDLFVAHPEVDVIYGKAHHIDPDDAVINEYQTGDWDFNRLMTQCFICQPALFFRRRVVDRFGPLDDSLDYVMDYEYWLRLAAGGAVFHHHPQFLAASRLYPETKTLSARVTIHEEIAAVQKRMFGRVSDDWVYGYAYARAERMGIAGGEHPKTLGLAMFGLSMATSLSWNRRLTRPFVRSSAAWLKQGFQKKAA